MHHEVAVVLGGGNELTKVHVFCHLVELAVVGGVVWQGQVDLLRTADAGRGHDGGVAALLLEDPFQHLAVQALHTGDHLEGGGGGGGGGAAALVYWHACTL